MKIIDKTYTNKEGRFEYPIGHIFDFNRIKIIVQRNGKCKSCFFTSNLEICIKQKCLSFERVDGKSVSFHVFKDYENNKKNKFKKWFWSLFNRG